MVCTNKVFKIRCDICLWTLHSSFSFQKLNLVFFNGNSFLHFFISFLLVQERISTCACFLCVHTDIVRTRRKHTEEKTCICFLLKNTDNVRTRRKRTLEKTWISFLPSFKNVLSPAFFSSYTHRECAVDFTDNDNDWTWGKVKVQLLEGPICFFWPWYRCLREGRCPLQMEKYFVLRLAGSVFTPSNNWELTRNENTRSFCV